MRQKALDEVASGQTIAEDRQARKLEHRDHQLEVSAIIFVSAGDEDDVEVALWKVFQQFRRGRVEKLDVVVLTGTAEVGKGDLPVVRIALDRPNVAHARLSQRHPKRRIA